MLFITNAFSGCVCWSPRVHSLKTWSLALRLGSIFLSNGSVCSFSVLCWSYLNESFPPSSQENVHLYFLLGFKTLFLTMIFLLCLQLLLFFFLLKCVVSQISNSILFIIIICSQLLYLNISSLLCCSAVSPYHKTHFNIYTQHMK